MTRTSFLVGISAIALATGAANAQTVTDNTDANGNRQVNGCVTGTFSTCTVTNQAAGNTLNTGSVGSRNSTGATPAGSQLNSVQVTQTGNRHFGSVDANGNANLGSVTQTGNNNSATVAMTGTNTSAGGSSNASTVRQGNNDNRASISQTRPSTVANTTGTFNNSTIDQGVTTLGADGNGVNNLAQSTQNGNNLRSSITQNAAAGAQAASFNTATVSQTGVGNTSSVTQSSRGNNAIVTLGGGGVNSTDALGNTLVAANLSTLTQTNGRASAASGTPGAPAATSALSSGNSANIAIIGLQNTTNVTQDGLNNSVTVSVLGGGTGNTANTGANDPRLPASRPEGNQSTLSQYGINNVVNISAGGRTPTTPNGRGNLATVTQGDAATISDVGNARNMTALIFQRGTGDTVQITQNNNSATIGGTANVRQDGSYADVSQLSLGSTATITQTGTNRAEVAQGLNADGTGNNLNLTINQTDLGDTSTTGTNGPGGPFGGSAGSQGSTTAQRNLVQSSQSGIRNVGDITQTTVGGRVSLFQARLSQNNTATVTQGTGSGNTATGVTTTTSATATTGQSAATSVNLFADITQTGFGGTVLTRQDGTNNSIVVTQAGANTSAATATASNNSVTVDQANSYQSTILSQSGYSQTARVQQFGTTSTQALPSVARLTQTGYNNSATIFQTTSSGASNAGVASGPAGTNAAFPNARPAGSYSAEAIIIQDGTNVNGNVARIDQDARGGYARINQSGNNNSGRIIQTDAAINAVAILEQSGNGNAVQITQNQAGQYIRVQQTGGQNSTNATVTEFSQNGGNGGTLAAPTF